eukprot:6189452-Pleurochrysis_carterae.AAC.2
MATQRFPIEHQDRIVLKCWLYRRYTPCYVPCVGWNIDNILLDLTGGSLSLAQLFLDAACSHDWTKVDLASCCV